MDYNMLAMRAMKWINRNDIEHTEDELNGFGVREGRLGRCKDVCEAAPDVLRAGQIES